MTKSKKFLIGVVSLLIILLVGLISYRVRGFYSGYDTSCSSGDESCCSDFIAKCEETGGAFKGNSECRKQSCSSWCPEGAKCIAVELDDNCHNVRNKCKCPFLKRWSDQKGCTYF